VPKVFSSLTLVVSLLLSSTAFAEDAFYKIELGKLTITAGKIPPAPDNPEFRWGAQANLLDPYARLDEGGEIYCEYSTLPANDQDKLRANTTILHIRADAGRDVTGKLYLPKPGWAGMAGVSFKIPASAADANARMSFYNAKAAYYEKLTEAEIPGGAWFRRQAAEARIALGQTAAKNEQTARPRFVRGDMQDTFSLLSGSRAISENLQLDRVLTVRDKTQAATVDVDSLVGIKVREMDWAPLVKDLKPELDPLASLLPGGQHAMFFPSFDAMVAFLDEAERTGSPLLQFAEPRSEDALSRDRYQRQLGLSLTGLGRLLGPKLIGEVAITGSDPYLRVGSDIAILFEAKDAPTLRTLLSAQIGLMKSVPQAQAVSGNVNGVPYTGYVSAERAISSYMIELGPAIIVSNSLKQLERLVSVQKHDLLSLASLPEYTFFRNRYVRGNADETALLVLSDATIRRWSGPRWRIADSRRTRAAAVMTALQAEHLDSLVRKTLKPGPITTTFPDAGEVALSPDGVRSSIYGSLDFMTPIIELNMDKVTQAEAKAYEQWRTDYEQYWKRYFDPIAVRFTIKNNKLGADITVMPLIAGTEYRQFMEVVGGQKIGPASGDLHDDLAHFALSIDKDSRPMKQAAGMAAGLGQGKPLDVFGWLGDSISWYADEDPYWQRLVKKVESGKQSSSKDVANIPIAFRAESTDLVKLTALINTLLREFLPNAYTSDTLQHQEQSYVKLSPTEKLRDDFHLDDDFAIYYATMPDAFVITLNQDVMKHALERYVSRLQDKAANKIPARPARPFLGSNVCFQLDGQFIQLVGSVLLHVLWLDYQPQMQMRAWSNIPILNEWKRLYPDQDPIQLHERFWQSRLICPGGGNYVWNAEYQTMESTIYGHPGRPKTGPPMPAILRTILGANFGVDFENNGLRARAMLDRKN
jgi:hypothetical protein